MGQSCHQPFKETGPWFQIKCVKDNIIGLEARGQDATFQRDLLKSWSKYDGYEGVKQALKECGRVPVFTSGKSKNQVVK